MIASSPSNYDRKQWLIEWQEALRNARSFNTLLLQLRGFGIPIVITIMGGGVAFASNIDIPNIPVTYASIALVVIAFLLVFILVVIGQALQQTPDTALSGFEKSEGYVLIAIPLLAVILTTCFRYRDLVSGAFVVANPGVIGIVLFALILLLGLYGIDRCYYYRMLIGAVKRAAELEALQGFELTSSVAKETPPEHAKTLITTMYWLPALGALSAAVVLTFLNVWTGQREPVSDGVIKCLMDALK